MTVYAVCHRLDSEHVAVLQDENDHELLYSSQSRAEEIAQTIRENSAHDPEWAAGVCVVPYETVQRTVNL